MSRSFSWYIAQRYLWSRRGEAFITIISVISVLGVALGVAVICIVMSVMGGFEHELRSKILGANSHITVRSIGTTMPDWHNVLALIGKNPQVASASPYTYNQALLRSDRQAAGVLVRGILPDSASGAQLQSYLGKDPPVEKSLGVQPAGSDGVARPPSIVIGQELSHTLALFPGQNVSLLSPNVTSSPFGLVPRFQRFDVSAVYSSGLIEYESSIVYMHLADAQRFFQLGDAISGIEIRLHNMDLATKVSDEILTSLGGIGSGYIVKPWSESNRQLWDAIHLEKRVYFLVLLLIVVMASFSIVTMLIMIVLEKRKDIAVLMTMGADQKTIAAVFRWQGATIGAVGVVGGLVLGIVGCVFLKEYGFPLNERVFQMSSLPVRPEPLTFIFTGISAFMICLLATLYPAWRASAVKPAELLRSE